MKTRVFFGLNVIAPWVESWPQGRIIAQENRHITLAFLGNVSLEKLDLDLFPIPNFKHGFGGRFVRALFLPYKNPKLVAWEVDFFEQTQVLESYQKKIIFWLQSQGLNLEAHSSFLPHMTICREPKNFAEWKDRFQMLPMYFSDICLYESLGLSEYKVIWQHSLHKPFIEQHHTADLAFLIYGQTLLEIYRNARIALSFHFPSLIHQNLDQQKSFSKIEDVVIGLNDLVTEVDIQEGIYLKAVSFHGKLIKQDSLYQWEMIVDV